MLIEYKEYVRKYFHKRKYLLNPLFNLAEGLKNVKNIKKVENNCIISLFFKMYKSIKQAP